MDLIFRKARTHNGWQAKQVSDQQLRALYDLMKWAPTTKRPAMFASAPPPKYEGAL